MVSLNKFNSRYRGEAQLVTSTLSTPPWSSTLSKTTTTKMIWLKLLLVLNKYTENSGKEILSRANTGIQSFYFNFIFLKIISFIS